MSPLRSDISCGNVFVATLLMFFYASPNGGFYKSAPANSVCFLPEN